MENIHVTYDNGSSAFCSGVWDIVIGDKEIAIKGKEMNTRGFYETWEFDDSWSEKWKKHEDGLKIDEWVKTPPKHLIDALKDAEIEITETLLRRLYEKIQPLDWRHLSCGACV